MKKALFLTGLGLVIALAANTVLAIQLADLRSDFDEAQPEIEAQLADAIERLEASEEGLEGAIEQAEAASDIRAIRALRAELTDLERTLFGAKGPEKNASYKLGDLQDDLRELLTQLSDVEEAITSMTRCFNQALEDSFDSFAKAMDSRRNYTVHSC